MPSELYNPIKVYTNFKIEHFSTGVLVTSSSDFQKYLHFARRVIKDPPQVSKEFPRYLRCGWLVQFVSLACFTEELEAGVRTDLRQLLDQCKKYKIHGKS